MMMPNTIARNYAGGLVGYIGYDAMSYFEPALNIKTHSQYDRFMFGVYTDGIVLDKLTGECYYFYYDISRIDVIKKLLEEPTRDYKVKITYEGDNLTKEQHEAIVNKVKEHIVAGNTFQCQVGLKSNYKIKGNSIAIYDKLRTVNPSPYMYYVKFKDVKIIGASPELLFRMR